MNEYRDFDETAALGSFGLTRGGLLRMSAREQRGSDRQFERGRSWRLDGDGCVLESHTAGGVSAVIGRWIEAARRKLRRVPARPRLSPL